MMKPTPDPDYLLHALQADERTRQRGKLRIYFGAVAGVGKTYAMLQAAKEMQARGVNVLVGVVETHARAGTLAQAQGLSLLPKKEWLFQGKPVLEFDLDAAIAAQPELLLVDELAHSNVVGARHPKRWQDVVELLDLGIDVWTTLNVQHLESLNGVIEHITGVAIHETVPDAFFDGANEIVLVDTTAEELTKRLHDGHIYAPAQARRAQQHFFRKGNLISLREIALRRTAECIEADVKTHRQREAIQSVWQTDAGVLVCLSGTAVDEHLVRSGARMAGQLGAEWHVLFVDTPCGQKEAPTRQGAVTAQLRFAESLGAQTSYTQSERALPVWVAYAREHNLAHIMCLAEEGWWPWQKSVAWRVRALAPEINVVHVGGVGTGRTVKPIVATPSSGADAPAAQAWWPRALPYLLTLLASCGLGLALYPLANILDNANIIMLFLVLVVAMSVRYGRSVGVFASVISVALFDFGFVLPQHSFAVRDVQYLITFVVMLGVGLLTGQYALHLKLRARTANRREQRAVSLFEFAKNLSGQLEFDEIIIQSQTVLLQEFKGKVVFFLPDLGEQLHPTQAAPDVNLSIAQWAYAHEKEAGFGTDTLPKHGYLYLPLKAPIRIRGILAIAPDDPQSLWLPEKRRQLDVLASLIALTLERIHFAAVAQQATMGVASEQMRNTLLATISHDLRTPLTALMGEAQWLAQTHQQLPAEQVGESLTAIHDCAQRLFAMVSNLLEMARLQSDQFALNKEWHSMEELIGSVTRAALFTHPEVVLQTKVPVDCPLVECDGVLMERVLSNLLDNAIKYSAAPAQVRIEVKVLPQWLQVSVLDQGQGIHPAHVAELFEKFTRGEKESHNVGTGLGLSIAKTIITAHAGQIDAALRSDRRGSHFWFTLPLRPAPSIE
ncbi:MAG: sensor histidine kinase KdpD [Neisseriaceae bacterium]|nr:sensor histidine kinase KdpD [Neisseriaceae bacterium]